MDGSHKLRNSLVMRAISICIIITLSFLLVVSVIVGIQNRNISRDILTKSFRVIAEDLVARRKKLVTDSHQLAQLEYMGTAVNFITDYKFESDVNTYFTQDTYRKIVNSLNSMVQSSGIRKIGIYDVDGDLIAFSEKREDMEISGYAMGYPSPFFIVQTSEKNLVLPVKPWRKKETEDVLPIHLKRKIPEKLKVSLDEIDGIQAITVCAPISISYLDISSDQVRKRPVGIVTAVQPLDAVYEKKMSELTGIRINVLGRQDIAFVLKDLVPQNASKNFLKDPAQGQRAGLDHVIFDHVEIDGQAYFRGILPFQCSDDYVCAVSALYSKAFSRKHTLQMIVYMLLVSICCIVGIIPVAIFFSAKITAPIEALAKTAKAIESGDLDQRVEIFMDDEIGDLAVSFNSMAEKLQTTLGDLNRQMEEIKRLNVILESTTDLVSMFHADGGVVYINMAGRRMLGYAADADMGDLNIQHIYPEWAEQVVWEQGIPESIKKGTWEGETAILTQTNKELAVSQVIMAHLSGDGHLEYLSTIIRDITHRKEAEEALRRLRNLLRNIIDSMPSVLIGVDIHGSVTQWNKEAERMTGLPYHEAIGRRLVDVCPQLQAHGETVKQVLGERVSLKERHVEKSAAGDRRYSDVTVFPLVEDGIEGAVIRVDDVTERIKIDEMMVQNEKMMSVGGLAAGMAHEINNPLAGILQNVQVIRGRIWGDIPANQCAAEACGTTMETICAYMERRNIPVMIDMIMDSGRRAAEIVTNMLSFSRKNEAGFAYENLDVLLDKTIDMAGSDYDFKKRYDFKSIEIMKEYQEDMPEVLCDRVKIQQVFLNIIKNSAYALAEHRENVEAPHLIFRVFREKEMARVEIEDNGPGMDEATRKRVFEPFFTTKSEGVGTGLGLSVSYFIIKENHQGTIQVESTEGEGTRFIILLPIEKPA